MPLGRFGGRSQAMSSSSRRSTRDRSPRLRMDAYSNRNGRNKGTPPRHREIDSVMKKARKNGTQSTYWNKKLLEAEEKDPNRWRHSGYKELYHGEKRSSRSKSGSSDDPLRSVSRSRSKSRSRSRSRSHSRSRSILLPSPPSPPSLGASRPLSPQRRRPRSPPVDSHSRSQSRSPSKSDSRGRRVDSRRSLSHGRSPRGRGGIDSRRGDSKGRSPRRESRGRSLRRDDSRGRSPRRSRGRSPRRNSRGRSIRRDSRGRRLDSRGRSPKRDSRARRRLPGFRSPRPRSPPSRRPPSPKCRSESCSSESSSSCSNESCSVCSRKGRSPVSVAGSARNRRNSSESRQRLDRRRIGDTVRTRLDRSRSRSYSLTRRNSDRGKSRSKRRRMKDKVLKVNRSHYIKVESESESSSCGGNGTENAAAGSTSGNRLPGLTGGPKLSLSERFGRMAQWSVDRDLEHRNLRITTGDRLTVEMDSPPSPPYPPNSVTELGSWDDVRVRYTYYKEHGYLRDLTLQDYIKWEQWWYKYQDWLDNDPYYDRYREYFRRHTSD